jgi:hypothetical protein
MGRSVTALAAAALLLVPSAAAARTVVRDPNDSPGLLDVRRVSRFGARPPVWKISTARRWSAARVQDRGYLLVFFDTFGDDRSDYYALVRSNGREMKARLMRDPRRARDRRIAYLTAWRRDKRSVSVRVPLRRMTTPRRWFVWRVETLLTGPRCKRVCFDVAPPSGRREPLPGAPSSAAR